MGWAFYKASQASYTSHLFITRLVYKGTRSWFHSSHTLTFLYSLPDYIVVYVSGLGHFGGVEHKVEIVVLVETTEV
jgi:hypothetical protein